MACKAVRQALAADRGGALSLEAAQLVADLIRTRKCSCPPQASCRFASPSAHCVCLRCAGI